MLPAYNPRESNSTHYKPHLPSNALRIKAGAFILGVIALPIAANVVWRSEHVVFWIVFEVITVIPALLLVVWLVHRGVSLRMLGLSDPRRTFTDGQVIAFSGLALILFAVVGALAIFVESFFGFVEPEPPPVPEGLAGMLTIVYYSLTAALVEETLFRGVPAALVLIDESERNRLTYILASGVAFGAWHESYGWSVAIACALVGFAVAALYVAIRNLWPLIAAHFAYDVWAFWPLLPSS